ncbi:hypothetical protein B0T26DRAFT_684597 [Lasiosphaeria miniovina]|uniref:Zn(2)-C6 fungal-type domain-containing protein n=1 Tax=Lasiosphaeria miniovina TaxID=1954250 RepID=A0AA40EDJ4_9PEZI|nr:uncharacterized protein B0T26DRAFT_684597 [Lasiosphaeria miniovina]KAK0733491.1 hypothetical protein B0T26DRAFT_684597 [Lasiosphaeria miniovina]
MAPRRSHKKSRAGCRRCKSRKIKCDEVHPRCGGCVKHAVACDFENPSVLVDILAAEAALSPLSPSIAATSPSTPAASIDFGSFPGPSAPATPLYRAPSTPGLSSTTPPSHRLLELRLMHQYTAMTCKTITFTAPVTEEIWSITVPNLAFSGSQHLADAILAVAALHLRSITPNDRELVRASHAYMAATLAEYSAALTKGIDHTNAESLFLTSALIAFQSTATRVFMKDELSIEGSSGINLGGKDRQSSAAGSYTIPFSWFHSFQGVKAITAASWQYLRVSPVATQVINSQAVLQLDFSAGPDTFFGHLLDGLDEELAALGSGSSSPNINLYPPMGNGAPPEGERRGSASADPALIASTRQAYQHAVAVLNWAHKIPHKGAPLAFPATVSRRYIELLEERQPRALAILACFFALLKSMDRVWWLQGMARREVLGVVSIFNSDFFGPEAYREWWPHLEWAMQIALYEHTGSGPIPADVWGADWYAEEAALARGQEPGGYFRHIELLSQMGSI